MYFIKLKRLIFISVFKLKRHSTLISSAAHKIARVGRRPLFCHRRDLPGRGQAAAPGRRVQGHQVLLDQLPGPRQGGVHVLRGRWEGDEG